MVSYYLWFTTGKSSWVHSCTQGLFPLGDQEKQATPKKRASHDIWSGIPNSSHTSEFQQSYYNPNLEVAEAT